MTTNLDMHILDDADLDAVNGGADDVHDACVRAVLRFLWEPGWAHYGATAAVREDPCLGY